MTEFKNYVNQAVDYANNHLYFVIDRDVVESDLDLFLLHECYINDVPADIAVRIPFLVIGAERAKDDNRKGWEE